MTRKIERIFPFHEKPDARQSIGALLNLGPKSSEALIIAGIKSVEKIRTLGPIEVCRRVRARGYRVSVVMAYALEGALTNCHWNAIPWETKEFLRVEFAKMKREEIKKTQTPIGQP